MNSDIVAGKWKQWKGHFWSIWAEWFDSDCAWFEAHNDYLSGIVQEDYGREQERSASGGKRTLH
ncbi:stress-response protein [Affinibrenneria salicis]|uniref:Stress-response protein n=1 Tax=Affinibrenneria salicis TaxID=2590031 RepID=A0A5J5FZL5_9GAMM|nr:stress-response protein [Affinibrenneria salicis]KAA8999485.1 stress-response protein [Affinibrenneria salicis]